MEKNLGGIRDMEALPDALYVIDTNHEHNAVHEANRLGIQTVLGDSRWRVKHDIMAELASSKG